MLEQNNPDLVRQFHEDHRTRLLASNRGPLLRVPARQPGLIRLSCGQLLIQLGERIRGAKPATVESRPAHLALAE